MRQKINRVILVSTFIFCLAEFGKAQFTGLVKTGLNIGTINKEWWTNGVDSIKYEKPLLRPILGIGAQYVTSSHFIFRQEVMFQIKGQGTSRPDVRSVYLTSNPDILRFISFPFTIHKRIIADLYLGIGVQPSLYLSGTDNHRAKENWHGWIYSGNINIQYIIQECLEIGFEYDYDFTSYYCPGCDEEFSTYRIYAAYNFIEDSTTDQPQKKSRK